MHKKNKTNSMKHADKYANKECSKSEHEVKKVMESDGIMHGHEMNLTGHGLGLFGKKKKD